ncbi:MAG: FAD-dependent oxidoreductase [Xylophilus ampelinus]
MDKQVAILGAGMVGTACALELQRRGYDVTLLDRRGPGRETSHGNAGVIARSSLVPFNHPGLWATLPHLLRNRSVAFRYDPRFLARNLPWALGFLARARASHFDETTRALDALIRRSMEEHLRLLAEAGAMHRLRRNGWLFLHRSEQAFDAGQSSRDLFARFGIRTQALDGRELSDLEPHLRQIFPRALWIQDAASVDSPGDVVDAYARLFVARGGRIERDEATGLEPGGPAGAWRAIGASGRRYGPGPVVVALGPWAREFCTRALGLRVPMAFERGYHMHYAAAGGASLARPVYDAAGGYVLSPMAQGLRLSTGVQLARRDAPKDLRQLDLAERAAREAFPLARRLEEDAWLGSRPTLPDSRPTIGECPGRPGVWLAFGHQHIGFSTGPGTAALLGALMDGEPGAAERAAAFRPARFLH